MMATRGLLLVLVAHPAAGLVSNFTNFTNVESYGSLAGRTLRVAFLPYADEVKSKDPGCCSEGESCTGCEWEGDVISVYTKIQLWTGFSIEEVVVSNESRIAHPKSESRMRLSLNRR